MCGWLCVCQDRRYLMGPWMETLCHQQWATETVAKLSSMWVGLWEYWMHSERDGSVFLKPGHLWSSCYKSCYLCCLFWRSLKTNSGTTMNSWGWRSRKRGWHRLLIARKWFWVCCNNTKKKELVPSASTAHRGAFVILISPHCCSNSVEAKGFMYGEYIYSLKIFSRFIHNSRTCVFSNTVGCSLLGR